MRIETTPRRRIQRQEAVLLVTGHACQVNQQALPEDGVKLQFELFVDAANRAERIALQVFEADLRDLMRGERLHVAVKRLFHRAVIGRETGGV